MSEEKNPVVQCSHIIVKNEFDKQQCKRKTREPSGLCYQHKPGAVKISYYIVEDSEGESDEVSDESSSDFETDNDSDDDSDEESDDSSDDAVPVPSAPVPSAAVPAPKASVPAVTKSPKFIIKDLKDIPLDL